MEENCLSNHFVIYFKIPLGIGDRESLLLQNIMVHLHLTVLPCMETRIIAKGYGGEASRRMPNIYTRIVSCYHDRISGHFSKARIVMHAYSVLR